MKRRIVVVGGLAAGPAAAAKAKRIDPSADVTLLEAGEDISYGICEIPYFISGTVGRIEELSRFSPSAFQKEKGVKVHVLHKAEVIHHGRRVLEVRDFLKGRVREIPYDKLILATGSRPVTPGVEGEKARNVFAVKALDEAKALHGFIESAKPKRAVIAGGGYIGMEMAEALRNRGLDVTVLHRWDMPMWGLEAPAREAVAEVLKSEQVAFIPGAEVNGFELHPDGSVKSVRSTKGSFSADLVVLSMGVEPNVSLAAAARIRRGQFGGIITDQRQLTNVDGIYAAGDCCEVRNLVSNKRMYCPLATIAARQGRVAGENAAGGSAKFKGALRAVGVKVFSLEVARTGLSSKEALEAGFQPVVRHIQAPSRVPGFPGTGRVHIVTVSDRGSNRLLGANVFGQDGVILRANTLSVALQNNLTMEDLHSLDLIYTPTFTPLWDPLLIAGGGTAKRNGS